MFYRNRTLGFNYRVALWFNSKGINYESQSDQPPEEDLHYCSPGKISVLPHAVPNIPHLGSLPEADVDAYGGSVPGRVALSRPLLFHKDTVTPLISFSAKSLLYQQPHCTALSPLLTQHHIQSKHECIKDLCNQCDYQATRQSHLKRHIQSYHA